VLQPGVVLLDPFLRRQLEPHRTFRNRTYEVHDVRAVLLVGLDNAHGTRRIAELLLEDGLRGHGEIHRRSGHELGGLGDSVVH
jgi:hypothetical protein